MVASSVGDMHAKSLQSCPTLCNPMDGIALQAPLSMDFSRQEYWSGLSFPSPGDLPKAGTEPASLVSPALAGGFFTTEPAGKPILDCRKWREGTDVHIHRKIIQKHLKIFFQGF